MKKFILVLILLASSFLSFGVYGYYNDIENIDNTTEIEENYRQTVFEFEQENLELSITKSEFTELMELFRMIDQSEINSLNNY